MQNRSPWKFFLSLFAFVVFAAVSCYFTAESLILSEALGKGTISVIFTILLVIGFFILTSLGSKWAVDSLMDSNQEHPWLKLIGGLLIVCIFWLCVSFPTNIHSLIYNRAAKSVALDEMAWLETGLGTISDTNALIPKYASDEFSKEKYIETLQKKLEHEIYHPNREGVGDSATRIIRQIETELGLKPGTIFIVRGRKSADAVKYYNDQINNYKEAWKANTISKILGSIPNYDQDVKNAKKRIEELQAYREALKIEKNKNKVLRSLIGTMDDCYALLNKYEFFKSSSARQAYHGMSLARLTNVGLVVYGDYLHRRLSEYDIPDLKTPFYLVLIALLFDLAAFLFFNIAFQKPKKSSIPKIKKPR